MRKENNDSPRYILDSDLYPLAADCNKGVSNVISHNKLLPIWLSITFLYSILKMYRNSIDGSTASSGGIWNVINISYVVIAVLLVMSCIKKSISLPNIISEGFICSFFIAFMSFLNPRDLSVNMIFGFAMLFYFPSVALTFYYASSKGFSKTSYNVYSLFYFILAAFAIYLMYSRIAFNRLSIYQTDAYFLLCALPLVFLFDKGLRMYIKVALVVVCLILAAKRTGFVALAGAVFVYYLIDCIQKKNVDAFLKVVFKLLIVVILFFLVYSFLATQFELSLLDRMKTITEDGGSGRDDIYTGLMDAILESDFFDLFFGHGLNGIQVVYGRNSGAHNDFLEYLYNFGVFAPLLLAYVYVKMVIVCIKMTKANYPGAKAMGASIVIAILMSMFSNYFVTFTHITISATFWGVILSDWDHYQYNKSKNKGCMNYETYTLSK